MLTSPACPGGCGGTTGGPLAKRLAQLLLVASFGAILLPSVADAQVRQFLAKAYALDGGALVFVEDHIERWRDGELLSAETTCFLGKRVVVHRTIDFKPGQLTPSSRTDNLITGGRLVVTVKKGGIELERKEDGEVERETVRPPALVVTPGSVPLLATRRWDDLVAGKPVDFSMPVPSRLEWYSLRLRKVRSVTWKGRAVIVVALTPKNAALQLIAPTTEFFFDRERRALVKYEGRVFVTDADGDRLEARVEFFENPVFLPPKPIPQSTGAGEP